MANTYEVTDNEKESFVVETSTATTNRTYQKDWLVKEIARLQLIRAEFDK